MTSIAPLFARTSAGVLALLLAGVTAACTGDAAPSANSTQTERAPAYATEIPAGITTPDVVETRLGTLRFFDGMPDEETARLAYDNLDFQRGVSAFLNAIPIASVYAIREGFREAGATRNNAILVFEDLMDSRSLFLTPNTTTYYTLGWIDLSDGPVVLESPPNVLGTIDDFGFRFVTDVGNTGPEQGRGGKHLLLPPDYDGPVPSSGYYVSRSRTYGNLLLLRAFPEPGNPKAGVENVHRNLKIYQLSEAADPPAMEFINASGMEFNTIHSNDFHFYDEVNEVIQAEPTSAFDAETLGLLASIGIKKGTPFAPDERMRAILEDAIAVGNATARAITFATRDREAYFFEDRQWKTGFVGGSYEFLDEGTRRLDARTLFHYYATGITPAMAIKMVGAGSQYAYAERDSEGRYLDGGNTYRITLPPNIPVNNFWSFVVYDSQTRSMLQTDQQFPGIDGNTEGLEINADGSVTVYFAPTAPEGHESNWVQTWPGKSWHVLLRLYGPLEPWFDGTWVPGDFELVQ
jgi:hypothetical protein